MCGILGKAFYYPNKEENKRFEASLSLMTHRGPDDYDFIDQPHLVLGHRRLSIIDLSQRSKQPFFSDDKNVILAFNGEVYNYQELKKDLELSGYTFRTTSDTEVLTNLFHRDGISCISKLNGMFSIAIYDQRSKKFYLIRDRLGIKPLYYFYDKNAKTITFSSEVRPIINFEKSNSFGKNQNALSSYLSFRYPILNDSFFNDIDSVKPGHYLEFENGSFVERRYWDPSGLFQKQHEVKSEEFYIERVKELLESSVKYRMISDVPFGAFLSGGVDSSVITAIMAKNSTEPIRTFTIGFEQEGYNEFEYSRIISERYNTDHQEIILSGGDYLSSMEDLIELKGAPLSVPNEIPLSIMSKELKKKVTVVLSGEGADEIFGGYGRIFRSPYDFERSKPSFQSGLNDEEKRILTENLKSKYGRSTFASELDHFYNLYSYIPISKKEKLLTNAFQNSSIENKFRNRFQSLFDEVGDTEYTNKIMYAFEMVHIQGLLNRVDNSTMSASVEARVPFVDHRLVEFAFSIPLKYKLKWVDESAKLRSKLEMSSVISEQYDVPKYILKKAYEGVVDNEILYRRKMGFPVPLNKWLGGSFRNYAKEILLDPVTERRGELNLAQVEQYLGSDGLLNTHSDAMHIWMLINNELFNRKYFDNEL